MRPDEIQDRLERSGRTLSQVAEAAGLSVSTVSRYVRGESDARGRTLERIREGIEDLEKRQLVYLLELHGSPESWQRTAAETWRHNEAAQ